MKKRIVRISLLLVLMLMFSGCAVDNKESLEWNGTQEDLFLHSDSTSVWESTAEDEDSLSDKSTQIRRTGRKIYNQEKDEINQGYLTYTGGEMTVEYGITVWLEGDIPDEAGVGLWVFLDGIPQAYRLNDGEDYQYMHTIFPEPEVREIYDLSFVPTVGSAGDELDLAVVYVLGPHYMPEKGDWFLKNSVVDESGTMLKFEADTPGTEERYTKLISQESVSSREVSIEERDEFLHHTFFPTNENGEPDVENNSDWVRFIVYLDGEEEMFSQSIAGKERLSLKIDGMMGMGVPYRCVVFLNNEPVGWTEMTENRDGEMTTIEMDLDVSGIEDRAKLTIMFASGKLGHDDYYYWTYNQRILLYR